MNEKWIYIILNKLSMSPKTKSAVFDPNTNTRLANTSFNTEYVKADMKDHFKEVITKNEERPTFSNCHIAMACVFDELCNYLGKHVKNVAPQLSNKKYDVTAASLLAASKDIDCLFRFDLFSGMTFSDKFRYGNGKSLTHDDITRAFAKFHPDIEISNSGVQWMLYICQKVFAYVFSFCDVIKGKTKTINEKLVVRSLRLLFDDSELYHIFNTRITNVMKVVKPDAADADDADTVDAAVSGDEINQKSKKNKKVEPEQEEDIPKKSSKKSSKKDVEADVGSDDDDAPVKKKGKKDADSDDDVPVKKTKGKKDADSDDDAPVKSKKGKKDADSDDDTPVKKTKGKKDVEPDSDEDIPVKKGKKAVNKKK